MAHSPFGDKTHAFIQGDGGCIVGAHGQFQTGKTDLPGVVNGRAQQPRAVALSARFGEQTDADGGGVGAGLSGAGRGGDPAEHARALHGNKMRPADLRQRTVKGFQRGMGWGAGEVQKMLAFAGDLVERGVQAVQVAATVGADVDTHGGGAARAYCDCDRGFLGRKRTVSSGYSGRTSLVLPLTEAAFSGRRTGSLNKCPSSVRPSSVVHR